MLNAGRVSDPLWAAQLGLSLHLLQLSHQATDMLQVVTDLGSQNVHHTRTSPAAQMEGPSTICRSLVPALTTPVPVESPCPWRLRCLLLCTCVDGSQAALITQLRLEGAGLVGCSKLTFMCHSMVWAALMSSPPGVGLGGAPALSPSQPFDDLKYWHPHILRGRVRGIQGLNQDEVKGRPQGLL